MPDQNVNTSDSDISDKVMVAAIKAIKAYMADATSDRSEQTRVNTALIAYMDRIILLAGGTLTLVFTVVANLSVHLHTIRQNALHSSYVVVSCWLLVASILLGLLSNITTINLQRLDAGRLDLARADSNLKLSILESHPNADITKIPNWSEKVPKASLRRWLCRASTLMAQMSLALAFIFLALFVQVNLPILLLPIK